MKKLNILTITERNTRETVHQIDFQEILLGHQERRVAQLKEKYPIKDHYYKWS